MLPGIRVLDLGQVYNGPYAGFLLALAGADVVKVEPPGGENLRRRPALNGADYPFLVLNANKRSIVVDLKSPSGRETFTELASVADVVIENFAPGVMDRLGVGYEALRRRNPRLVYATGSGYGLSGPYRDLLAMDLTVQAMSGVMSATGFPENPPVKSGAALCDFLGGVHLYAGIVTALLRRTESGEGGKVEVAMLDSVLPSLLSNLGPVMTGGDPGMSRTGNHHGGMGVAPYNVYTANDGYVAVICANEDHWVRLAKHMGRSELADDPRFATREARVRHMDEVDGVVAAWVALRSRDEVAASLRAAGVPVSPVRELAEVAGDEHLLRRRMLQSVPHPGRGPVTLMSSPIRYDERGAAGIAASHGLGEDQAAVLAEWLGADDG